MIYVGALIVLFFVIVYGAISLVRDLPNDIGTHDLADDLHKKVER